MRVCCYYPWFPAHWQANQPDPPLVPGYSSLDPAMAERHFRNLAYAKIDAALVSWWGQGSPEDAAMPLLLETAARVGIKVAVIHEPRDRSNPARVRMRGDLDYIVTKYAQHPAYLKMAWKPAVWVFSHNDPATVNYPALWADWQFANGTGGGRRVWLAMRTCYLPGGGSWKDLSPPAFDSWWDYEIGAYAAEGALPHGVMISPGRHTHDQLEPELPRNRAAWEYVVARSAMLDAPVTVIVSYNEWEEGTGIEPTEAWGSYFLDVLART